MIAKHVVYISPGHMDPTYAIEREVLGPNVDLRPLTNPDRGFMDGVEAKNADAIMTWRTKIDADAIAQLEKCRIIVRLGVGYDIVDAEAAFGAMPLEILAKAERLCWLQAPQAAPQAAGYAQAVL